MGKSYLFNGNTYKTLNDLGMAFSENYFEALNTVFKAPKALIKFVRKHNKEAAKNIAGIITSCKYQNSALTMIIFNLCDDKRVVINNKLYTLKDLVSDIKKYKDDNKAIYAFIHDMGITRTYATLNIEPKLLKDSYFIEKNITNDFAFEYLTSYFTFDYLESIKTKISNVFIYDEEKFRRASKIIGDVKFQLLLAHKVGFKDVMLMRKHKSPVFSALKLLNTITTENFLTDDLKKLVDNTFFWWLLDNVDNYQFKKEAANVKKALAMIKKIKLSSLSFDDYIDVSEKLYDLYLLFVQYMKKGLITVKKKELEEEYICDKPYCKTYICVAYMKNNPVKLAKDDLTEEFDEEVVELTDDDMVIKSSQIGDKKLKKQGTLIKKINKFISFTIFYSAISILLMILILVLPHLVADIKFMDTSIWPIMGIVAAAVAIALSILLFGRLSLTREAYDNFIFLNVSSETKELTPREERRLEEIKITEDKVRHRYMRAHRILSAILMLALAASAGITGLCGAIISKQFISEIKLEGNLFIYILPSIAIGFIYGLIRKRKGALSATLIYLLSIASAIILAVLM